MDKIAADPEIINRSVTDTGEPPVVVAPPQRGSEPPAPQATVPMSAAAVVPSFNLLAPNALPGEAVAVVPAAVAAPNKRNMSGPLIAGICIALLAGGGATAIYMISKNTAHKPVIVKAIPSAPPAATPTATPLPTPEATPTPRQVPAQVTVTAPAVAPTVDHPQAVTVKSRSGLWLRSTPNSSDQKNVIGWIPFNGVVSVDAVGDFWWHGTFSGKSGYFAVNYTN